MSTLLHDIRLPHCPFCGNPAHLIERAEAGEDPNGAMDIGCKTFGCYLENGAGWYLPLEEVVRMWSQRATYVRSLQR